MKPEIIYADPPWDYDNKKSGRAALGGYSYPPMTTEELAALPVGAYAADNCILFMWATFPKLPEALRVMAGWGFTYTTGAFVWVKLNRNGTLTKISRGAGPDSFLLEGGVYSGTGHWTNGNEEFVLLGKKGRPKRYAKNVKKTIFAPVGRHSAKPPETRDRIVALAGDLPRVEFFARDAAPGWVQTGYDFDGLDIREFLARGI